MTGRSAKRLSRDWRLIVCALFGFAAASIASCTGMTFVVQQYEGPPRPKETVAVIRTSGGIGPELVSVDGEPLQVMLENGNRLHVEVLPGTHEVELAAPEMGGLNRAIPAHFIAEPGKVYRFELRSLETATTEPSEPAWEAFAYEVDRKSDALLRIAPRPPGRAPPLAPAHETALPPPPDLRAVEAGADASGEES
jgi:hypothetical protein